MTSGFPARAASAAGSSRSRPARVASAPSRRSSTATGTASVAGLLRATSRGRSVSTSSPPRWSLAAREPSLTERGVDTAAEVLRSGLRPFAAPRGQARTRRATDVVVLVPAVVGLLVAVAAYPPSSFELALVRLLHTIPGWIDPFWEFTSDLLWLCAVALVLVAIGWRRLLVVCQAGGALVVAVLVGLIATRPCGDSSRFAGSSGTATGE